MRRDLDAMLALADRLDAAGEIGVFATLLAARGSSYRPVGSMMLAGPPGTPRAGGVSGGCLEEYIARHGRERVIEHGAALLGFDTSSDGDPTTARPTLGCGGHVDILIERFTAEHRDLLMRLREAAGHGPAAAVRVTASVRGSDRETLDPVVQVRREWEGPQPSVADRATGDESLACTICVAPQPRLLILGAGNDAQPLAELAAMTDWSVSVIARRARLATRERFPSADCVRVVDAEWSELAQLARPGDWVVMLTHDLADDIAIGRALGAVDSLSYVGVLGPAHRLDWVRDGLRAAGVSEGFIESIRGPIGLDLGGRSPEQIALAIVAELTAHRFGRDARPLASRQANTSLTASGR